MTRTVLKTTIRKKLGEATAVFWAESDLNQWIEDGQLDVVWRAKLKRTRGTFTTTASTARYTLSTILPNLLKVVNGGVWIYSSADTKWFRCEYKTKEYMDVVYPDWPNASASKPIIYMEDIGEDLLELYPPPDSDHAGADYCRVYHTAKPTAISADSGSPDLPVILHPALVDYTVAIGFETRGYGDLANDHWAKYYDKIKTYLSEKENKEDEEIVMKNIRNIEGGL